ncbi:MAG TPA: efflux transporter outer membrane subunit [Burkholderiales bacterium]|nr:efflux transporter outer membrane subunit [Burkholderiales bacterium]
MRKMIVGNIGARFGAMLLRAGSRRRCIVAAVALALTACSVGPQYERPVIAAPTAWRDAQAHAPAVWPATDWWRGFGSPQLDAYIAQAQRANDDIAAAVARVREADAQTRIAGSALLPAVAASAGITHERTRAASGNLSTYSLYTPEISAAYELDFWGKNRAALRAAKATLAASRYDRATVELTVVTGVASTYFLALELRDRLSIAQNNLASAEVILKGLKFEQTAGTANALDVAQQETTVATLDAAIPPLEQQLRQSVDALAILLGKAPEAIDVASGGLLGLSQPRVQPGLPSELLARRPDVARAEAQLVAANANIALARAAYFPNIQLTASSGFASAALSKVIDPANAVFSLAAGLTQPIFEGGALEAQSAYARARYAELLAAYHKTVISAFADVEDALVALQKTSDQLQRQQRAVATARRAYEIAQAQLHAGTINVLALLNTESALFTAEDAMARVKLSHLQALIGLFNALGGGWQNTTPEA